RRGRSWSGRWRRGRSSGTSAESKCGGSSPRLMHGSSSDDSTRHFEPGGLLGPRAKAIFLARPRLRGLTLSTQSVTSLSLASKHDEAELQRCFVELGEVRPTDHGWTLKDWKSWAKSGSS